MNKEEILQSCKDQLKIHVDMLLEQGERKANIEIELMHYMKKLIYKD
jgi:hypothetical protein